MLKVEGGRGRGRGAPVSLRRSGIDEMHFKGTISDAEKDAADRFTDLWEAQHTSGLKAIDCSRQRVDCGTRPGLIPRAYHTRAYEQLAEVQLAIGDSKFEVLRVTAGEGGGLSKVMSLIGKKSKDTASRRLRAALAALCQYWSSRH